MLVGVTWFEEVILETIICDRNEFHSEVYLTERFIFL